MNLTPDTSLFRPEVGQARQCVEGEIILRQPVRTNLLVCLILVIVVFLGFWVSLGTYSRTETARGILATAQASTKIVALRPGQVTALRVSEGDVVRAGQPLAVIQTEETNENGGSSIGESLAAIDTQRMLAERQLGLVGRRADSDRARLTAVLSGLTQQRLDLDAQISLQEQAVASARDMFERIGGLLDRGFISRIEVERRRQAYIAAQQDLARLHQQRSALASESSRTAVELSRVATDADNDSLVVRNASETLSQQSARLRGERAYVVTAPIAGRVAGLQTAMGRSADPSIPLMEIVPEHSPLIAQVYAPTRAIGFIHPGNEVRLLYDAFPYQRFGSFGGTVTRISRTVIDPRQLTAPLGIEEPVYRIEVALDAQAVAAFGNSLVLQPGMTLSANLILDRRSFLDWLLTPLNAVAQRDQRR